MRKHYDFSNAVKNPHAGKFKDGYTIVVEHKDYDEIVTITKSKKLKDENGNGTLASTTAHLLNT
jgi:hypothetical protein